MAAYFRIIRASFFPLRYGQWLGPLAAAALFIAAIATATIATGAIDLAADIPHPQAWAQLLHLTFKRSVGSQSAAIAPPADLMRLPIGKGAMMFDAVCANCHGTPGRGQSLVSLSMRPRPQYLPAVINQFNDAELFWIVKHGVKYSAMPAFPTQLRDDEVWTVVAFLRAVPTMDQAHYAALTATPAIAARQAPPAAGVAPHRTGFRLENNNAVPAMGFGGQRLGTDAATGCAACHGADGAHPRSGGIPVLGLLDPDSIRAALQAYADGTRHSGYMQPVAAQLSPAAIDALALQFGATALRRPPPPRPRSMAPCWRAAARSRKAGCRKNGRPPAKPAMRSTRQRSIIIPPSPGRTGAICATSCGCIAPAFAMPSPPCTRWWHRRTSSMTATSMPWPPGMQRSPRARLQPSRQRRSGL